MSSPERKTTARQRARQMQLEQRQAEKERLARVEKELAEVFTALDEIDSGKERLGMAFHNLLDEGEKKAKLLKDFGLTSRDANQALALVGSAHAPGAKKKNTKTDDEATAEDENAPDSGNQKHKKHKGDSEYKEDTHTR